MPFVCRSNSRKGNETPEHTFVSFTKFLITPPASQLVKLSSCIKVEKHSYLREDQLFQ